MGSKQTEINCINRVLQFTRKSKGITKQILSKLNSMELTQTESPDFVFARKSESGEIVECIGVEHFEVDQISKINGKSGKIQSLGGGYRKEVDLYQKELVERIKENALTEDETVQVSQEIYGLIAKGYENQSKATYWSFIKAFEYSLKKHLDNVENYRRKLAQTAQNVKLAFVIELHTEFTYLYLCDSRGIRKNTSGNVPIFDDMVRLLEKASKKVDFIILEMRLSLGTGNGKVIAFSTQQIRKQLNKQNIRVYKYAGEDYAFQNFESIFSDVKVNIDRIGIVEDKIALKWMKEFKMMDLDQQRALMFNAFYRAWYAKQYNMDFVTTLCVLSCLEIMSPYILSWQYDIDIKGINTTIPVFDKRMYQDYDARKKAFDEKWCKAV